MQNTSIHPNSIILQIKSGDEKLLAQLYTDMSDAFLAWMSKKFKCSEADALDIYNESFTIFYRNILEGKLSKLSSSIKTYIYAIAKYLWIGKIKKQKASKLYEEELLHSSSIVDNNTAQQQLESTELLAIVEEYIDNLKDPCKSILHATLVYEQSTEEIIKKLNYKNRQVLYSQKKRCLEKLQSLINRKFKRTDF